MITEVKVVVDGVGVWVRVERGQPTWQEVAALLDAIAGAMRQGNGMHSGTVKDLVGGVAFCYWVEFWQVGRVGEGGKK